MQGKAPAKGRFGLLLGVSARTGPTAHRYALTRPAPKGLRGAECGRLHNLDPDRCAPWTGFNVVRQLISAVLFIELAVRDSFDDFGE